MSFSDITERENYQMVLDNKVPEWVPCSHRAVDIIPDPINEQGIRFQGGRDVFGVNWLVTEGTALAPTPDPGEILLRDVTKWKEAFRPPDLSCIDWAGLAESAERNIDRKEKMILFDSQNFCFQRLMSLMGLEGSLIALYEEPEACYEFFDAVTNYKLDILRHVDKYFHPDIFCCFDDVAHKTNLFLSADMFRTLIKPHYMRFYKEVIDRGMIPEHHICGFCEDIYQDLADCGIRITNPAEPVNDIALAQQKYHDQLIFRGGIDSFGKYSWTEDNDEMLRAEVRRCMDNYAPAGNYIFAVLGLYLPGPWIPFPKPMEEEYDRLRFRYRHG
ncbi:MAG: hypothetical protein LBN12_01540 [Clostridiales Family XIII bacterium]|jgi:hypothetical protein|nr:hypothetical protein [Clostridiales Family XIII bacterium]